MMPHIEVENREIRCRHQFLRSPSNPLLSVFPATRCPESSANTIGGSCLAYFPGMCMWIRPHCHAAGC